MKSIIYIIPYFGKLPKSIDMWLLSCKMNPTVDWLIFTDDKSEHDYPENVKVKYCTFDEFKQRIQDNYDFKVNIYKPWKLCEFKPTYGEIFAEEIKGYDFWGHCDMDLIWGDIRHFITDEILDEYDRIGPLGHSTIYRNTHEVNTRYKEEVDGLITYKEAFMSDKGCSFDEEVITALYTALNKKQYTVINFANLHPFTSSFYLVDFDDESESYKNNRQAIVWKNGKIFRYYNYNGKLYTDEEFMYFHTFMRPIKYRIDSYDENNVYIAYPDVIKRIDENKITYKFIQRHGTCPKLVFYIRLAWSYRKKLTIKKVINGFKQKFKWEANNKTS